MTDLEVLQEIKTNLLAKIRDISLNPKPNYSIDGQSVSHSTHLRDLMASLKEINAEIASLEPVEIISQLYS